MNRAVSPSPGPSDRLLPVGEGKSVRPPAAGSWKEWALHSSARRARTMDGPSQKGPRMDFLDNLLEIGCSLGIVSADVNVHNSTYERALIN